MLLLERERVSDDMKPLAFAKIAEEKTCLLTVWFGCPLTC